MMTVKHIEIDGHERLFTVASVSRTPEGKLVFDVEKRIDSGKVYIMNDAGKTVAVYDFGAAKHRS